MAIVDPKKHASTKGLGPGKYLVGCASTNSGESSKKGTPYVQGRLVALEDLTRGRDPDEAQRGKDILYKLWQTEKAVGMLADVAMATGKIDPFDWELEEDVAAILTAGPFVVTVRKQKDNPQYTEVRWPEKWDGRMSDGSEPSEETRAEWREMLAAAAERHDSYLDRQEKRSSGGSSLNDGWKAPETSGGASFDDDDDIPF